MSYESTELSEEDVLLVDENNDRILLYHSTYRVDQMVSKIKSAIRQKEKERAESWLEQNEDWFEEGVPCKVLKVNSRGWLKGRARIKFTLEFYPEGCEGEDALEGDSNGYEMDSLNEIRQILSEGNI